MFGGNSRESESPQNKRKTIATFKRDIVSIVREDPC